MVVVGTLALAVALSGYTQPTLADTLNHRPTSPATLPGAGHTAVPSAPALASIDQGTLQGLRIGGVEAFKGIPFAAPPIGALRWEPPQPPVRWDGVRRADHYEHDCMQNGSVSRGIRPSEDCLYLNVWRPVGASHLPVMVWIYGGGFVSGGTSPAVYDGSRLAGKGVVLVSFNYRLGRFGFFAFPALTAEHPGALLGNYGFMDQIAALRWVQANIGAFGGDPHRVMVFGESAGGISVNMLLTSPLAAGLFQEAGIESGAGRSRGRRRLSQSLPGLPSAEAVGVNFAHAHGIDGTGAAALAALRALPAAVLATGTGRAGVPPTYSGPMLDGRIVVTSPEAAYQAGQFARVPLLIGANSADLGPSQASKLSEVFAPYGSDRARALAIYDPEQSDDPQLVATRVAADRFMVEPARFVARMFAQHGEPVYEYRFSYVAPALAEVLKRRPYTKGTVPGAPHASEIPYVFDTVAAVLGSSVSERDEAVAEAASTYWTNFAKFGNPNGHALPGWPVYAPERDELMNFTQQGPKAMRDPWHARLDLTAAHAH
jgi:para-nitrobenzyl esterase